MLEKTHENIMDSHGQENEIKKITLGLYFKGKMIKLKLSHSGHIMFQIMFPCFAREQCAKGLAILSFKN